MSTLSRTKIWNVMHKTDL